MQLEWTVAGIYVCHFEWSHDEVGAESRNLSSK